MEKYQNNYLNEREGDKYKNIKIEGPIFVNRNYVKWIRHYEDFDGKVTSDVLESRYGVVY